jgi:rhodanese-related sulfurtransferase
MKKFIAALALAFAAVFALSACTSAEPVELGANAVIIDVRTAEEYATGHLDGAVNIDVQSPDFGTIISQLPTDGEYFVYCRSGNRSGQAIAQMEASGFSDLTNGGSVAEASSMTGIPVVK